MDSEEPVREILFENGTVAYAGPGHSFGMKAADGGQIKKVSERHLSKQEMRHAREIMKQPSRKQAELRGGAWKARAKTVQELRDEGLVDDKQAEEMERDKKPK